MVESNIDHEDSAGWLVNAASVRVNGMLKTALAPLNLTQGQFAILKTLAESDNLNQTEIGKCVDMPGYSMTRNLDILEQRDLLARHPDEHSRRSFRVRLTDQGTALSPQLYKTTQLVNEEFLEPLNNKERDQLKRLLRKLTGAKSLSNKTIDT